MHHLCSFPPQTSLPTQTASYFRFNSGKTLTSNDNSQILHGIIRGATRRRSNNNSNRPRNLLAMEKESSQYEVDQDKAKQALDELDQQFELISTKQPTSPKVRASSIGNLKDQGKNEPPEITGSFLGYTAFVLFIFTIFYNVLFITVIKPSIDGPDKDIAATDVTTSYQAPDVSQSRVLTTTQNGP